MAQSRLWLLLERLSTVALLVVVGLFLWTQLRPRPGGQKPITVPKTPISIEKAATIGSDSAPVAMVIYSDFQCPFCARFARDTWPRLAETYVQKGQLLVAFRHLPLPNHPLAAKAAEAAECARAQGKFWEMHDLLFGDQAHLSPDDLKGQAGKISLNREAFDRCLGGEMTARVKQDAADANSLGILPTPTFLFGKLLPGRRVMANVIFSGAKPLAEFQSAIAKVARAENLPAQFSQKR